LAEARARGVGEAPEIQERVERLIAEVEKVVER
jgi:hypothetical protein